MQIKVAATFQVIWALLRQLTCYSVVFPVCWNSNWTSQGLALLWQSLFIVLDDIVKIYYPLLKLVFIHSFLLLNYLVLGLWKKTTIVFLFYPTTTTTVAGATNHPFPQVCHYSKLDLSKQHLMKSISHKPISYDGLSSTEIDILIFFMHYFHLLL